MVMKSLAQNFGESSGIAHTIQSAILALGGKTMAIANPLENGLERMLELVRNDTVHSVQRRYKYQQHS